MTPRYPAQPSGIPWPTETWPVDASHVGADVEMTRVSSALGELFDHGTVPPDGSGISLATVVVHRGHIVAERYGTQPDSVFGPGGAVDEATTLVSWSMAKSITHALVGMLVAEGRMDPGARAAVAEWVDDDRSSITLRDLLRMRDGLHFVEDYVADESGAVVSHVIDMLFGDGASDVASYARSRPLAHAPGSVWSYSSGTTNIISSLVAEVLDADSSTRAESMRSFIVDRLLGPLGMASAVPRFDDAGTFIGSSYVYATARDFARFGYLYLRGGEWDGREVLPRSWVDSAFDMHAVDPDSGHGYSHQWWLWKGRADAAAALGYEGQRTIVDTSRDLVVVHLGKWGADTAPRLDGLLNQIVESFPVLEHP